MIDTSKIGILGAGAWGTALALVAARAGRQVLVWTNSRNQALERQAQHASFPSILWTTDMTALQTSHILLVAVPAQHVRQVLTANRQYVARDAILLSCAKGIELDRLCFMTDVFAEVLPNHPRGVLSGPNFASEILDGLPAATTIAIDPTSLPDPAHAIATALDVGYALVSDHFRPYASDDVIGVQIAGVIKNVLAIACGIAAGLKLGENARAALITRGLHEMITLGCARGAKSETFYGLAGVGDLVLTGSSLQSRNFSLGYAIAEKGSVEIALKNNTNLAEGVFNAQAVLKLAQQLKIDIPLVMATAKILMGDITIYDAILGLLARPLGVEG